MNPQDPLAALAPLREPAAIGWWPLAPGWWLLLGCICLLLALLGFFLWRRWSARAYRRLAQAQLEAMDRSGEDYYSDVNRLLKAVALRSYGSRQVAQLSGSAWLNFLQSTARGGSPFPDELVDAPYRDPRNIRARGDALYRAASDWLSRHGEPT